MIAMSARQRVIAASIAAGISQSTIADALQITDRMVRYEISELRRLNRMANQAIEANKRGQQEQADGFRRFVGEPEPRQACVRRTFPPRRCG